MTDWEARWAELERAAEEAPKSEPRFFRPLADAVDGFLREARATHRILTGIPQLDEEMRGISDGHLCLVNGFSSGGKTLFLLHVLRYNRDKRVVLFTPDETSTLVLTKLATVTSGIPAREIEEAVRQGDADMVRMLQNVALEEFPNLVVFDRALDGPQTMRAYQEACDHWGDKPDFVAYDYLELFPGGETVPAKAEWLKAFGMTEDIPLIVLHQTSRSSGAEGRALTISSGAYGGEQQSTFVIGVRRRKAALEAELAELRNKLERQGQSESLQDRIEQVKTDLRIHRFTVTMNLVKNKRPGGMTVDEFDYELDVNTGRIFPLAVGDLPRQFLANRGVTTPKPPSTSYADDYEQEMLLND